MQTVAILGATGMIGNMIYKTLNTKYKFILVAKNPQKLKLVTHKTDPAHKPNYHLYDAKSTYFEYGNGINQTPNLKSLSVLREKIHKADFIINCIGIIKPLAQQDPKLTFFINGALPHILSRIFRDKLIHITTDCVFDGLSEAPYSELSLPTPVDIYGLSKNIGEPIKHSLTLRSSFIGPEINTGYQLLEWTKRQKNKTVQGFTNHMWNGLTTRQLAVSLHKLMQMTNRPKSGIFHLFSSQISKFEILKALNEKYELNMEVIPTTSVPIDRRLCSIHSLCADLDIPSFSQMRESL